jgi:cytochrome b561
MQVSSSVKYRPSIIALHWLTLLLLVGVYACIEFSDSFPRGSDGRAMLKNLHYLLGLSVFALTLLRLLFRATGQTPPITPVPPAWQNLLGKLMALLLYAMMLALPVMGYVMVSAGGHAITLGGFEFPQLVEKNREIFRSVKEVHETIGNIGYFLSGLHTLAALYHHYIRRDNTLLRMSPRG